MSKEDELLTPDELNKALRHPSLLNANPYSDLPLHLQLHILNAIKAQLAKVKQHIINRLENDFKLAPQDNSYLRLLVRDSLDYLKTGKTAKERADERYNQTGTEEAG